MNDQAGAVLMMPHWADQPFFKEVQPYIVRKYWYRKGTLMFEEAAGMVGGTHWPVWALLVDGRGGSGVDLDIDEDNPTFKITKSSGRRYRKRFKAVPLC